MPTRKKSASRAGRPSARKTDPFKKLEADHKEVARLFKRIENLPDGADEECDELFEQLKGALILHTQLEESIVYPKLQDAEKTAELTYEAFEEHHVAKLLLAELDTDSLAPEVWMAKLTVLRENVEHHVEEEEGELFPKARRVLDEGERESLKQEIESFGAHVTE